MVGSWRKTKTEPPNDNFSSDFLSLLFLATCVFSSAQFSHFLSCHLPASCDFLLFVVVASPIIVKKTISSRKMIHYTFLVLLALGQALAFVPYKLSIVKSPLLRMSSEAAPTKLPDAFSRSDSCTKAILFILFSLSYSFYPELNIEGSRSKRSLN